MADLEEVVGGNLEDAHQRILDRLRHVAEAALVVSTFEDMNLCEWHWQLSWFDVTEQIGSSEPVGLNGCRPLYCVASWRHIESARLMPIALNLMRTSCGPAAGTCVWMNWRTSSPPALANL